MSMERVCAGTVRNLVSYYWGVHIITLNFKTGIPKDGDILMGEFRVYLMQWGKIK